MSACCGTNAPAVHAAFARLRVSVCDLIMCALFTCPSESYFAVSRRLGGGWWLGKGTGTAATIVRRGSCSLWRLGLKDMLLPLALPGLAGPADYLKNTMLRHRLWCFVADCA